MSENSEKPRRRGLVRRILMIVLAAVFCISIGAIVFIQQRYRLQRQFYSQAAAQYTAGAAADDNTAAEAATGRAAPIEVDFDSLRAINEDIVGWVYCEGTAINYPVLQCGNNDTYLRHTYEGDYSIAGSIFIEALNRPGFVDHNMIVYGHHMMDDSMFSAIQEWESQEFYDQHPVMWLLTPQQNYRVDLFSAYTTSAYSDTYTIFTDPCPQMDEYLQAVQAKSAFTADVELESSAQYVVFSTCAYLFENARYVLHGKLVPV